MDTLHTVLRSLRQEGSRETKHRRDHLDVFREFLSHLDRATRRKNPPRATKAAKAKGRGRKR
jgi:hypothetical protein